MDVIRELPYRYSPSFNVLISYQPTILVCCKSSTPREWFTHKVANHETLQIPFIFVKIEILVQYSSFFIRYTVLHCFEEQTLEFSILLEV